MQTACVFCRIVAGEIPASRILETEDILAFLDIQPIEKGHTLVIPKHHYATLLDVPDEVLARVTSGVRRVAAALLRTGAEGINVLQSNHACAGQVVPHLHFHVIPRTTASQPGNWTSGRGAYASPDERDGITARLRTAVSGN